MALRPATPEVRLARMSGQAVSDGGFDKAILPVGATEYHGPHLPYGTDTIGAEALAEGIARELGKTIVLPALDYGVSFHHIDFPWTVSLRPETLSLMIRDIIESVMTHGIRKIAILTAHDGNPPAAESAARSLYQDHGIEIAMIGGWQGAARRALEGNWDIDLDHAGQSEMSLVLYGAPETARIDLAVNQPNQQLGASGKRGRQLQGDCAERLFRPRGRWRVQKKERRSSKPSPDSSSPSCAISIRTTGSVAAG